MTTQTLTADDAVLPGGIEGGHPLLPVRSLPGRRAPVLGSIAPRLWTRPARKLTPETSDGYALIDFARDVLGAPLDPWQEWLAIHALEKLEDGRPRFRRILTVVGRQCGKSHLSAVLACWWLWRDPSVKVIVGTSLTESKARDVWDLALDLALSADLPMARKEITTNGRVCMYADTGAVYKVKAKGKRGGRGDPIDKALMDEFREHDRSSLAAVVPAMNTRLNAQVWMISSAGDDTAETLWGEHLKATAGLSDPETRYGLFEWSTDPNLSTLDPQGWAQAQPQLGRRTDFQTFADEAAAAVLAGGTDLADFEIEQLCRRWRGVLDQAVDAQAWLRCKDVGTMDAWRDRVVMAVDVSTDTKHATLATGAVMGDGRVRVEVVADWSGDTAVSDCAAKLEGWLLKVKPSRLVWLPGGPAASMTADLMRPGFPPPGVELQEVRGDLVAVCMGLAKEVSAGKVAHSGQALLDAHVAAAERLKRGDGWVFSRRGGAGHVDAAYAAAAVVFSARTIPPKRRTILPSH